jgi:hypothetical protein
VEPREVVDEKARKLVSFNIEMMRAGMRRTKYIGLARAGLLDADVVRVKRGLRLFPFDLIGCNLTFLFPLSFVNQTRYNNSLRSLLENPCSCTLGHACICAKLPRPPSKSRAAKSESYKSSTSGELGKRKDQRRSMMGGGKKLVFCP